MAYPKIWLKLNLPINGSCILVFVTCDILWQAFRFYA